MSPAPKTTDQGAQSFVQLGLESLQRWRLNSFSGQPGPGLDCSTVTDFFFFIIFNLSSLWQIGPSPVSVHDRCLSPCPCAPPHKAQLCLLSTLPSGSGHLDFPRLPHDTSQLMGSGDQEGICFKTFQNCLS